MARLLAVLHSGSIEVTALIAQNSLSSQRLEDFFRIDIFNNRMGIEVVTGSAMVSTCMGDHQED